MNGEQEYLKLIQHGLKQVDRKASLEDYRAMRFNLDPRFKDTWLLNESIRGNKTYVIEEYTFDYILITIVSN